MQLSGQNSVPRSIGLCPALVWRSTASAWSMPPPALPPTSQPLLLEPAHYSSRCSENSSRQVLQAQSSPSLLTQLFPLSPRLWVPGNGTVEGPDHSSRRRAAWPFPPPPARPFSPPSQAVDLHTHARPARQFRQLLASSQPCHHLCSLLGPRFCSSSLHCRQWPPASIS